MEADVYAGLKHFKCIQDAAELLLIKEIHAFFKDETPLEEFQSNILNLPSNGRNVIDSLMYVSESVQIKTRSESIRMVLLFIAVETLMADSKYFTFDTWLISKKILGKTERDKLLENINLVDYKAFKSLIIELSKEYHKHYGVTNKVGDFFVNYLDAESKKRLIHSIQFFDKSQGEFVYTCFTSPDKCLIDTYDDCFEISHVCDLNNEALMNKILIKFIRFLNNYYRNMFVHEGRTSAVNDKGVSFTIDYIHREDEHIKIYLSHKDLKEIVIKGIKNYYFKHCL